MGSGASKNIIIIQSYLVGSAIQGRARCSVDREQLIDSVAFSLLGRSVLYAHTDGREHKASVAQFFFVVFAKTIESSPPQFVHSFVQCLHKEL